MKQKLDFFRSLLLFASLMDEKARREKNAVNIKLLRLGKLQLVGILVLWYKRGRRSSELKISGIEC